MSYCISNHSESFKLIGYLMMSTEIKIVTLKDIASKAGTSIATVSNVLANREVMVSNQTRQRIRKIASDFDYRPNRRARQLRTGKNFTISVHIDSNVIKDNVWRPTFLLNVAMLEGISHYALQKGYHTHLMVPYMSLDVEEFKQQVIDEASIDGVILLGMRSLKESDVDYLLRECKKHNISLITIDQRVYEKGVPCISVDLRLGTKQAAEAISKMGHRHIAYIGKREGPETHEKYSRFSLVKEELERKGVQITSDIDICTEIGAYSATSKLIREIKDSRSEQVPTCIFYAADHLAMAGMEAVLEMGLKIPEDISIIGVDNAPYACASKIPLASIDQQFVEQGKLLAKGLIDSIENSESTFSGIVSINSKFIHRASLGKAPENKD